MLAPIFSPPLTPLSTILSEISNLRPLVNEEALFYEASVVCGPAKDFTNILSDVDLLVIV